MLPKPFREFIELLGKNQNEISGVSFEEAEATKILVPVDGMEVPFISLEMLIKNKLSTNRDKDRVDADILKRRNEK